MSGQQLYEWRLKDNQAAQQSQFFVLYACGSAESQTPHNVAIAQDLANSSNKPVIAPAGFLGLSPFNYVAGGPLMPYVAPTMAPFQTEMFPPFSLPFKITFPSAWSASSIADFFLMNKQVIPR